MTTSTAKPFIHVQAEGRVPASDVDYVRDKVGAVLHYARDPVLFVRAKLSLLRDPAVSRPAVVQVNLNYNGRMVRAQVARETMREAIDEIHDRLRDRLQRFAGDWQAIRGGRPLSARNEWRHASVPTERPRYYPLPLEERQIVRHKAFALDRMSVDEAAFDMELLGYQFHLFTEVGTGRDSVLYRLDGEPGYRLAMLDPQPDQVAPGATLMTVDPDAPPALAEADAAKRLEVTGSPFVFFQDESTGRGCVIYHRYDGHYGLITPAG